MFICIDIFLQNFGKMKKRRPFVDDLRHSTPMADRVQWLSQSKLQHLHQYTNRSLLKLGGNTKLAQAVDVMIAQAKP